MYKISSFDWHNKFVKIQTHAQYIAAIMCVVLCEVLIIIIWSFNTCWVLRITHAITCGVRIYPTKECNEPRGVLSLRSRIRTLDGHGTFVKSGLIQNKIMSCSIIIRWARNLNCLHNYICHNALLLTVTYFMDDIIITRRYSQQFNFDRYWYYLFRNNNMSTSALHHFLCIFHQIFLLQFAIFLHMLIQF